ncbi:hypothetical protein LQR31_02790 [Chromobacterium vaccinii]|uniref:hypothetical protein n=1 Tax=Chromobacterium vaccinii TaxID=1108595 RepID=UPI001E5927A1|nr:hypothetical protein [Chromobacterium vaccinii]MCD4483398.1 hypothetical protein [Chromobacterium vaccinii]
MEEVLEEVLSGVLMTRPIHVDKTYPNISIFREQVSVSGLFGVYLDFAVAIHMAKFDRITLHHYADLMPSVVSVYPDGVWEPRRNWVQAQEAAYYLIGKRPSDQDVFYDSSTFLRRALLEAGIEQVCLFRYRK